MLVCFSHCLPYFVLPICDCYKVTHASSQFFKLDFCSGVTASGHQRIGGRADCYMLYVLCSTDDVKALNGTQCID